MEFSAIQVNVTLENVSVNSNLADGSKSRSQVSFTIISCKNWPVFLYINRFAAKLDSLANLYLFLENAGHRQSMGTISSSQCKTALFTKHYNTLIYLVIDQVLKFHENVLLMSTVAFDLARILSGIPLCGIWTNGQVIIQGS